MPCECNKRGRIKNIIIESDKTVKKIFEKEQDYYTEMCFYEEFKGFPYIPKLLKTSDSLELHLEYIDGRSLYDCNYNEQLCLAETLGQFHKETYNHDTGDCLIHFDTNLSNYIYKSQRVYMIDFSEIIISSPLSDVYSVLLFFAETLEPETFFVFQDEFLKIYYSNLGVVLTQSATILKDEINRFETRRESHNKCINNYHWFLQNKRIMENI